jgi:hypothetical protein
MLYNYIIIFIIIIIFKKTVIYKHIYKRLEKW